MDYIHPVFDMSELIRYVAFREKLSMDYADLQTTRNIKDKLKDVQDKARRGEIDLDDDEIYFIGLDDL